MRDDLYFLPLIERALRNADAAGAMRSALAQIGELGRESRYERGYEQFIQFVQTGREAVLAVDEADPRRGIPDELVRPSVVNLVLRKDREVVMTAKVPAPGGTVVASDLQPGAYELQSDTGWQLWEAVLGSCDLVWRDAFPGRDLAVAADTGVKPEGQTNRYVALNGALIITVFAGAERGAMTITHRRQEQDEQ